MRTLNGIIAKVEAAEAAGDPSRLGPLVTEESVERFFGNGRCLALDTEVDVCSSAASAPVQPMTEQEAIDLMKRTKGRFSAEDVARLKELDSLNKCAQVIGYGRETPLMLACKAEDPPDAERVEQMLALEAEPNLNFPLDYVVEKLLEMERAGWLDTPRGRRLKDYARVLISFAGTELESTPKGTLFLVAEAAGRGSAVARELFTMLRESLHDGIYNLRSPDFCGGLPIRELYPL